MSLLEEDHGLSGRLPVHFLEIRSLDEQIEAWRPKYPSLHLKK